MSCITAISHENKFVGKLHVIIVFWMLHVLPDTPVYVWVGFIIE